MSVANTTAGGWRTRRICLQLILHNQSAERWCYQRLKESINVINLFFTPVTQPIEF